MGKKKRNEKNLITFSLSLSPSLYTLLSYLTFIGDRTYFIGPKDRHTIGPITGRL
jgi:hypothetical protein